MENKFTSTITYRAAQPRSKSLQISEVVPATAQSYIGGGVVTHEHFNKESLDQITTDNDFYIWLTRQELGAGEGVGVVETLTRKVNAGGADKLTVPRKLWGQSFDGSGDVDGDMLVNGRVTATSLKIGDAVITFDNGGLHVTKGLFSDEFISALGQNTTTSGSGISYDRLDTWDNYTDDKSGYVLSALLGYDLHTRLGNAQTSLNTLLSKQGDWDRVYNWYQLVIGADSDSVINKWSEIVDFLAGINESDTLSGLLGDISLQIADKVGQDELDELTARVGSLETKTHWESLTAGAITADSVSATAFYGDLTGSATKLATARTLWGQRFDGTANVSGDMTGIGLVTSSRGLSIVRTGEAGGWAYGVTMSVNGISYGNLCGAYGGAENGLQYYYYGDAYNKAKMVITAAGNVGIGTKTPSYKLDVNGAARVTSLRIGDAVITYENGGLHVNKGLYSDAYVSALGQNGTGGTTGGSAWDLIASWSAYDPNVAQGVSATLIRSELNGVGQRLDAAEAELLQQSSRIYDVVDGWNAFDPNDTQLVAATLLKSELNSVSGRLSALENANPLTGLTVNVGPASYAAVNGVVTLPEMVRKSELNGLITATVTKSYVEDLKPIASGVYWKYLGDFRNKTIAELKAAITERLGNTTTHGSMAAFDGSPTLYNHLDEDDYVIQPGGRNYVYCLAPYGTTYSQIVFTSYTDKLFKAVTIRPTGWQPVRSFAMLDDIKWTNVDGKPTSVWGRTLSGDVDGCINISSDAVGEYTQGIRIHQISTSNLSSIWFGCTTNQGYNAGMWGLTATNNGNFRLRGGATSAKDLVVVTQSGNVGINIASPTYKLYVVGAIGTTSSITADSYAFKVTNTGGTERGFNISGNDGVLGKLGGFYYHSDEGLKYYYYGGATYTTAGLYILSDKKVGVNTRTPAYGLDVNATMRVVEAAKFAKGARFNNICIENSADLDDTTKYNEINDYSAALQLQKSSTKDINACVGGGNFGIGIASPSYKLHVNGTLYASGATSLASTLAVTGDVTAPTYKISAAFGGDSFLTAGEGDGSTQTKNNVCLNTWYGFGVKHPHANQVVPADTYAFWVNARQGKAYAYNGFYAENPLGCLGVFGQSSEAAKAGIGYWVGNVAEQYVQLITTDGANIYTAPREGSYIIGQTTTTNVDAMLYVNGTIHATSGIWSNSYISALGQQTSSDARLKTVTDDCLPLTIEQIAEAPAVKFTWKANPELGEQIGSIAQYWQRVLPSSVRESADGYLALFYGEVALVSSITLAKRIISHSERIKALEEEVERLKKELHQ